MLRRLAVLAVVFAAVAAVPSQAAPIFSDNFNSENGGVGVLNYANFSNFTVSNGTVDLIGNGFWVWPPVTDGHGLYVDLDGSTNNAGLMLAHSIAVGPGIYALSFDLAGNQRNGGTDVVNVVIYYNGTPFALQQFAVASTEAFTRHEVRFGSPTGNLSFSFHEDSRDNVGALLDNIELNAVPEPASLLLLGTGLVAVGRRVSRKRGH